MEDAQAAHVVLLKKSPTLEAGVPSTAGIKPAANALSHTKVEETVMPCFTTPTVPLTLDSGKSINQTGTPAAEEAPHAICNQTSTVPSRSINGEETPGNSGAPTQPVDVDYIQQLIPLKLLLYFKTKIHLKQKNHFPSIQDFEEDLEE